MISMVVLILASSSQGNRQGSDWRVYPRLSGRKAFVQEMSPNTTVLDECINRHELYSKFPLDGCRESLQWVCAHQCMSKNNSHFSTLCWRSGLLEWCSNVRMYTWVALFQDLLGSTAPVDQQRKRPSSVLSLYRR